MSTEHNTHISRFIRRICKDKSSDEIHQAELNFLRFLNLAERISTRLTDEARNRNPKNTNSND
ncbi:MAG: hypothetical protein ACK5M1_04715 [Xanthomarina gelatinilytica]|uniref:hypothetical protein n=1 Tax=Xanthomarina gelatinilytica TaxID=1137281 RepID=UPI003A8BB675